MATVTKQCIDPRYYITGNTLPLCIFRDMFPDKTNRKGFPVQHIAKAAKSVKLTAYNAISSMPWHAVTPMQVQVLRMKSTTFYTVDVPGPAIVGLLTCIDIKLVTMNCRVSKDQPVNTVDDLKKVS